MSQLAPVGYAGQKYVCSCTDSEGGNLPLGWTNDVDGGAFRKMVDLHPCWHSLVIRKVEK